MMQQAAHFNNKIARKAQKAVDRWAMDYWHDFPFGRAPRAAKDVYLSLWEEARATASPDVAAFEAEAGFSVDAAWLDDLALHTQIVIKESRLCYQHGRVLYAALRRYLAGLAREWDALGVPQGRRVAGIFETGTARGFSSVCMAKALADADCAGKIVTVDLLPHTTRMYWNCIDDHEGPKSRAELLSPWAELVDPYLVFIESDNRIGIRRTAMGRIHFAFLDGAHGYEDVAAEFSMVQQRQKAGDVIVFDDYNPVLFPGIIRGVDEGCVRWGYEKQVIGSGDARAYVIARKTA